MNELNSEAFLFLKKIIEVDTTNPPGNELPVAKMIVELLQEYGIDCNITEFEENRANVIVHIKGNGNSDKVLGLSGHMDVVPAGDLSNWDKPPFSPYEKNGFLYARGSTDMKAGLVSIIYSVISVIKDNVPLKGDIKLLITAGEEVGTVGAKEMMRDGLVEDVTSLIITEPTSNQVCIAEKGALWLKVITRGKTAHGSNPKMGINAIDHLIHVVNKIKIEFEKQANKDPLLGHPSLNLSMINGGVNTNVVPDYSYAHLDFRTLPNFSNDDVTIFVKNIIDELKEEISELDCEIEVINDLPPVKTSEENDFVIRFKENAERFFNKKKTYIGTNVYTDGATLVNADYPIPLVICGPGDVEYAHKTNERLELKQFYDSIALLKSFIIKELC